MFGKLVFDASVQFANDLALVVPFAAIVPRAKVTVVVVSAVTTLFPPQPVPVTPTMLIVCPTVKSCAAEVVMVAVPAPAPLSTAAVLWKCSGVPDKFILDEKVTVSSLTWACWTLVPSLTATFICGAQKFGPPMWFNGWPE